MSKPILVPDAPKDRDENALFRAWIAAKCESSVEWRKAVYAKICDGADGLIFWVDTFVQTKHPKGKDAAERGFDIPMISLPHQEKFLRWLHAKVMAQDGGGVIEKTREQQATWSFVALYLWFWLFKQASFLIMSRKEECVDGADADSAIMPRFDYIMNRLPKWQVPKPFWEENKSKFGRSPYRKFLNIVNPDTECTIKGESTNSRAGAGGRSLACLVDEAGDIDKLDEILGAIGQVTDCPFFLGTHSGVHTTFNTLCVSGNYEKYRLHWTDNTLWTEGQYTCEVGCKAHPMGGEPHSPRYDKECSKLNWDQQLIAAQLDINPVKSGNSVFDMDMVERAREWLIQTPPATMYVRLMFKSGPVMFDPGGRDAYYRIARNWPVQIETIDPNLMTQLHVWRLPFSCRDPLCHCRGTGDHIYVAGGDVATNSRGKLRDKSVLMVLDCTLGEVVACWSGYIEPDEAGIEWAKVVKWYGKDGGGSRHCISGIERNSIGSTTVGVMDKMGCALLMNTPVVEGKSTGLHSRDLGIYLTKYNRAPLINTHLAPAIRTKDDDGMPILYVPLLEFWDECTSFISIDSGEEGDLKADKVKMGAPKTKHDDHIWALTHALFTAASCYGGWRGKVRLPINDAPAPKRMTA